MGSLTPRVFDSNILIDYLSGIRPAHDEVANSARRAISIITFVEVLAGCDSAAEEIPARRLLRNFELIRISDSIAERAIVIRRDRRLKLPDALVLATVLDFGGELVTRNTKDFGGADPWVRVPYTL